MKCDERGCRNLEWKCAECGRVAMKADCNAIWNSAIDKAVEAIHKVIEDTGIPQDFDMNDLLDIEHDIEEELKKLKRRS
jgi:hypothetical protein